MKKNYTTKLLILFFMILIGLILFLVSKESGKKQGLLSDNNAVTEVKKKIRFKIRYNLEPDLKNFMPDEIEWDSKFKNICDIFDNEKYRKYKKHFIFSQEKDIEIREEVELKLAENIKTKKYNHNNIDVNFFKSRKLTDFVSEKSVESIEQNKYKTWDYIYINLKKIYNRSNTYAKEFYKEALPRLLF